MKERHDDSKSVCGLQTIRSNLGAGVRASDRATYWILDPAIFDAGQNDYAAKCGAVKKRFITSVIADYVDSMGIPTEYRANLFADSLCRTTRLPADRDSG